MAGELFSDSFGDEAGFFYRMAAVPLINGRALVSR